MNLRLDREAFHEGDDESLHDMNSDSMKTITFESMYWVLALEK